MKKTTSFITLTMLILSISIFGCSSGTDSNGNTVTIFEGGYLYNAGKLHVVQLNGDYQQMGRQYGYLLKSQIQSYYQKAINDHPPWGGNWSRENAEEFAMGNYANYPDRGKEILNGMAETSGLPIDQLVLIDQYTELFVVSEVFGCSSMAAWGDYTADGSVVQAKNEDMPEFFKEFNDSLVVVIYNPNDGSHSVASVCNAGQVRVMNAINDAGVVNTTNQAPFLEPLDMSMTRIPLFINHLMFMLDSGSLSEFESALLDYLPPAPINGTASDAESAFSYEVSPSRVVVRHPDQNGLTAETNHYVDPSWDVPEEVRQSDGWKESEERRNNLLALAEAHKGTIDADVMMAILDTPKSQGGATVDTTTYQVVAVPSQLKIWVNVPDYQKWVLVDLNPLFQ
ncbi:MAG: C45 family peptidase [Deltaproteobacteria bacterium]|nr:C45 family peptidase [Deltaproteobacteria bacterium]